MVAVRRAWWVSGGDGDGEANHLYECNNNQIKSICIYVFVLTPGAILTDLSLPPNFVNHGC